MDGFMRVCVEHLPKTYIYERLVRVLLSANRAIKACR